MTTTQFLLFDGSPFARPCDGQRNIATAPAPVVPGADATLAVALFAAETFRRVPLSNLPTVAAWRFIVADGLDRTRNLLFATDEATANLSNDTVEIPLAGAWTEEMRAALGDRPKGVFMAELSGYATAEDAGTATEPAFTLLFPFCATNRRDDGAETSPLRDLSMEAHNASPTAHPAIRDALTHKADLVNGKVPSSQLPSYDAPVPSTADPQMDGAASAGSSAAYARGDHRHPADTSRAAASAIVLEAAALGAWDLSPLPAEIQDGTPSIVSAGAGDYQWRIGAYGAYSDEHYTTEAAAQAATAITISGPDCPTPTEITRAATAYRLGPDAAENPNRDKTLAPADAIPAVVAPSTSSSDAGKAADAKSTGDALAGKLGTNGGTINGDLNVSQSGPSSGGNVSASAVTAGALTVLGTATISTLDINGGGLQINGTTFPAETWTFTLDDDSTVQKQLLVAPVAAQSQGGA